MEEGIPLRSSCSTQLASSSSKPMSSVPQIMQKAINLIVNSEESMLRVFALVLSPFTILVVLHTLIVTPLMAKVEDGYEHSSLNTEDLISFIAMEIPFVFIFCLVLLFSSAITIRTTVSVRHGGASSLSLKEILFSIKWKNIFMSGICITSKMAIFIGTAIILTRLMAVMAVLAVLACPYLATLSALVMAISTMEEECSSIKEVFESAVRVIRREGLKGYVLMLVVMLLSMPVYVMLYVTSTDDDDENGMAARYGFLLLSTVLFCLNVVFNNVVCALFYLDCHCRR